MSDGASTKSESSHGIQKSRSQPSSDNEKEDNTEEVADPPNKDKKKNNFNLPKRITRSSKDKDDLTLAIV